MFYSSREAAWYKYAKILFQLINTNAKNTLLKIACISLGGHKQSQLTAELHCAQKKMEQNQLPTWWLRVSIRILADEYSNHWNGAAQGERLLPVPERRKWLDVLTGCQLQVIEQVRQHTDKVAERTCLLEDMPSNVDFSLVSASWLCGDN